jgi:hypothetical protein
MFSGGKRVAEMPLAQGRYPSHNAAIPLTNNLMQAYCKGGHYASRNY